jgi:hypothetical protein
MKISINLKEMIKVPVHILYHVVIIAISAGIVLSFPRLKGLTEQIFADLWSIVGDEKTFILSAEIIFAVMLILFFNYLGTVWKDRRIACTAREAGLLTTASSDGYFARRRSRMQKEHHGISRDLMIIGSTGARTFTDPKSELHNVVNGCRMARIMLLNPFGRGADIRARSIQDPEITISRFREQIQGSIAYLKGLRSVQKNIRLKLYESVPFLKMTISGDYIWVRHYPAGLDAQTIPEYIFRHNQKQGSLYSVFYQYFLNQWNDPDIPEYDLETDELVFRDASGNEASRRPAWEEESVMA